MKKSLLLAILLLAVGTPAQAQQIYNPPGIQRSGSVTDQHCAKWLGSGKLADNGANCPAPAGSTGQIQTNAGSGAFGAIAAPSGAVVGSTDSQTLTNKTMDGANNTFSNIPMAALARPLFIVSEGTGQSNVTGDATDATMAFTTEVSDAGNVFAANTFTAPKAGNYMFVLKTYISGFASGHTYGDIRVVGSVLGTKYIWAGNPYAVVSPSGSEFITTLSFICTLALNETVTMHVRVSGGSKDVDISLGAASEWTGFLL